VINLQHLLAFVIVVGFPIWDVYETRRLKASSHPRRKILTYQRILAVEWIFALIAVLLLRWQIVFIWPSAHESIVRHIGSSFIWGLVTAIVFVLAIQLFLTHRNPKLRKKILQALQRMAFILPVTSEERVWFAFVSLTAGICEEILYRGFLIRYLAYTPWHIEVWIALVISSLAFGLAHSYQGIGGMIGTALMGAVLGVVFIVSGSLWLPILIHAAIDLRILILIRPGDLMTWEASSAAV
jgi:uncharacterized protein